MCLPALAVTVKPLADVITHYARSDRHKECDNNFHDTHPLSVASMGKGSTTIVPGFGESRKGCEPRLPPVQTLFTISSLTFDGEGPKIGKPLIIKPLTKEVETMEHDPNTGNFFFHALFQAHRTAVQAGLAERGIEALGSPLLMMLLQCGKEHGEIPTQRALAKVLLVSPAAIAMSLKSLERLGFVEKRTDPADQRRKRVTVTPKGEEAVETCWKVLMEVDRRMMEGFSPAEREGLERYHQRMLQNLMGAEGSVPENPFERMECQCSKP